MVGQVQPPNRFSFISPKKAGESSYHTHKTKVAPTNTLCRWVSAHLQCRTTRAVSSTYRQVVQGLHPFLFTLILYHKPFCLSSVFRNFF